MFRYLLTFTALIVSPWSPQAAAQPADGGCREGCLDSHVAAAAESRASTADERLRVTGDLRLRYEITASRPDRHRGVIRARLGATYVLSDAVYLGARLATGDPDDPNSTDVSMGSFVDDLQVSLDQAYVGYRAGNLVAKGGKLPIPFVRTDLVWDSDVNPYGLSADYRFHDDALRTLKLTTLYSVIDEQAAGPDSTMAGAQLSLDLRPAHDWSLGLHAGYYDYTIGSLLNADGGDLRENRLTADGTDYLSDFDLLDTVAVLTYSGIGSHWPVVATADYVRNLGAEVAEDTGYSVELGIGATGDTGDWRLRYGFAAAETDAVLAAFSHDNTTYGTNYRQHTLALDYRPLEHLNLNLTVYRYRRNSPDQTNEPHDANVDLSSRIRLNLMFLF